MNKRTRPHCRVFCSVTALMVLWSLVVSVAEAQTPTGSCWWPSEWGPDDERGASHRITPDRVVEAARLIQELGYETRSGSWAARSWNRFK
jgi:hypothetical protein